MIRELRALGLVALVGLCVAGAVAACSPRDRASVEPQGPSEPREQAPAQTAGAPQPQSLNPVRTACRPAGALGPANPTAPGAFLATFDADPSSPLGVCGASEWDIQIHSRNNGTWYELDPMDAQHGEDCGPPPASHPTHGRHASAVFLCRNHLMTALNAGGYGVVYLTPNQLFDFSSGGTLTFDISTERMSSRDWWDVIISPYEDNLALPLISDLSAGVDLQGEPRNAIHIGTDNGEGHPALKVLRDGELIRPAPHGAGANEGIPETVNQAATRQRFQLTIANGRMSFARLASATAPGIVFWDVAFEPHFTVGVVQFGQHSYTPTKDGAGVPATWHWDNIGFSPAIPFTINRAVERYADPDEPDVHFEQPAGEDAMLRFGAIGLVELSFDGGRTWSEARRQEGIAQSRGESHPEHFSSFWTPAPPGTTSVRFRFKREDWYTGPYLAAGIAIWER